MRDLLTRPDPWVDVIEPGARHPADACPACGAELAPSDLEFELLGPDPLSCRRCGAVIGH